MPKMSIDGVEYEFKPGQSVLQLAHENGIDVPYFCYHPGLSVAGNCRMCLVEIEGAPKPDISCNIACKEGLKVKTQTDTVKKLQQGVMEFLLLNHPLDCPVCDQAGECWLQEYYMDYARHPSAMRDHKTEKPKAVPLGPLVILDAERCILCTRCIRFLDEVTHTSELTIVNRGGHAEISLFPGNRLENLYSSNVVDICPVGALTNRDFRFQQRVWFLKTSESVCNLCSNGCNLHVDSNAVERNVYRVRPRTNMDVNSWWMCDIGRDAHKGANAETRVRQPLVDGKPATWHEAGDAIRTRLAGLEAVAGVAGPWSTNEALWAFRRLTTEVLRTTNLTREVTPAAEETAKGDDFLLKADRTPNRTGLENVLDDASVVGFDAIRAGLVSGKIQALFLLERDLVRLAKQPDEMRELLSKAKLVVAISSQRDATTALAHVVLPAATHLEQDGTFANFAGRVQRLKPAFAPLFESRPAWAILDWVAEQLRGESKGFHWKHASEVFGEIASRLPAFGGLSYARIGDQGALLNGAQQPPVPKTRGERRPEAPAR